MPPDTGQFVLDVDASSLGVGAVLQQEQNGCLWVIAYASHKNSTEQSQSTSQQDMTRWEQCLD